MITFQDVDERVVAFALLIQHLRLLSLASSSAPCQDCTWTNVCKGLHPTRMENLNQILYLRRPGLYLLSGL